MRLRFLIAVAAAGCAAALLLLAQAQGTVQRTVTAKFAMLRGSHEVDADGNLGAGDPDGRGSFTGIVQGGRLCFGITVAKIGTPVAAHVHKGKVGKQGAVAITLKAPKRGGHGASSGCVSASSDVLADIAEHPGRYYVNVHTSAFPDGAIRGQLFVPTDKQDR